MTELISEINECAINNGNCSQLCTNTIRSYYCTCTSGYLLNSNKITCIGGWWVQWLTECIKMFDTPTADINECATNNGNCSQICTNRNGSFICSCTSGYALNSNNRTCSGKKTTMFPFIIITTHNVSNCDQWLNYLSFRHQWMFNT